VTRGAGVEDCPLFDGLGVGGDRLEERRSSKGIIVGGVRTNRKFMNYIGAKFSSIVRP
jgi:hypothetical protein